MELVTPGIGLIFWMLLSFSLVLFILGKYAWKPIMNALKEREESIEEALKSADKAREEMEKLKADNDAIIKEAQLEREKLLKEAREIKDNIVEQAKKDAAEEAKLLLEKARISIRNEKTAAFQEIKKQVAYLSVEIAEKILREKLSLNKDQQEMIARYLNEVNLN